MAVTGLLTSVDLEQLGSAVVAATPAGAVRLPVEDVSAFTATGGGIEIGFINDNEDAVELHLDYSAVDTDTEELILNVPTPVAVPEDAAVLVYPILEYKVAQVDTDAEDEALEAFVSHALSTDAAFEIGERAPGAGAPVVVELVADRWTVVDVIQRAGQVIADTIIGVNPDNPMTDGLPPETAAIVTASPFAIGAISASWLPVPNRDPVQYRVYAGLTSPVPLDDLHYVDTTPSTSLVISRINDEPLPYDEPTYVVVVVFDDDGDGPASDEVFSSPRKASGPDIAANYVYAGEIESVKIRSGTLQADLTLSGRIRTSNAGQRLEINGNGLQTFNATEQVTASLTAAVGGLALGGTLLVGTATSRIMLGTSADAGQITFTGTDFANAGWLRAQTSDFGSEVVLRVPRAAGGAATEFVLDDRLGPMTRGLRTNALGLVFSNASFEIVNAAPVLPGQRQNSIELSGGHVVLNATTNGDILLNSRYVVGWPIFDFQAGTGNSRQVWVNENTGRLHTPTSARRFKQDIVPMDLVIDDVLALEPVCFRAKVDVQAWQEGKTPEPTCEPGFIADDLVGTSLEPFVQFTNGEPAGIHYDRVAAALIPVLQDLHHRVTSLEGSP